MTKAVIAAALAESMEIPMSHALVGAEAVMNTLVNSLKADGRFTIPNFGSFRVAARHARPGINPKTGEKIQTKASHTVRFKAAPNLVGEMTITHTPKKRASRTRGMKSA